MSNKVEKAWFKDSIVVEGRLVLMYSLEDGVVDWERRVVTFGRNCVPIENVKNMRLSSEPTTHENTQESSTQGASTKEKPAGKTEPKPAVRSTKKVRRRPKP